MNLARELMISLDTLLLAVCRKELLAENLKWCAVYPLKKFEVAGQKEEVACLRHVNSIWKSFL